MAKRTTRGNGYTRQVLTSGTECYIGDGGSVAHVLPRAPFAPFVGPVYFQVTCYVNGEEFSRGSHTDRDSARRIAREFAQGPAVVLRSRH